MENTELKAKDIPMGYARCFNDACNRKGNCMHYHARLLTGKQERHLGQAVYPTAWQDGECKYFREKRFVQKAWGFTHLYDNVPQRDKADARRCVRSFFSGGNGPYYRYHHGENLLSPEQQDAIMKIIAKFGSTDGIRFDHYVEAWDFG